MAFFLPFFAPLAAFLCFAVVSLVPYLFRVILPLSALFLPPPVSSFLFCHSEEGLGPPKNLFSARFVSRPRASLSRPHPPPHCFRPALPTPTLGRPPHTHPADARSPCVLAPACYICTPSPKKRFFEGISALFLSEIPLIIVVPTSLQNIYFYKYILSCNNYLYARKHCTPWRGFSRGWRGVFARALFQGSARAPKRLFVGVFSAPEWPE